MAKLSIIVGMGGSGKSALCDQIAKNSKASRFHDATLTKPDRKRAGHECLGELVARLVGRKEDCVMDEPHLVNADFLKEFKEFCDEFLQGVEQKWIFFERNVVACISNVRYDWERENGRKDVNRLKSLANQVDEYKVPPPGAFPGHEKVEPVEVYGGKPLFTEEEAAICWLYKKIFEEIVIKK